MLPIFECDPAERSGSPIFIRGRLVDSHIYYDEDGDGKFETLEEGLDYFARGHIPKWVLEK